MNIVEKIKEKRKSSVEQKIRNVLNSFTTDHIVIASVDYYEVKYQATHVAEIIGFYDEKNNKVIDINTGQVYTVLPIVGAKYITDPTLMGRIEMGQYYVRTIRPLSSIAMDSFQYSRTYDFTTIDGVRETLLKPYQDFITVTNGTQNIDYFYKIENQLDYFIRRCIYLNHRIKAYHFDQLDDNRYRVSKYGNYESFGDELCYHHIKQGKPVIEGIKTGSQYYLCNDIQDAKDQPMIVIDRVRNVSYYDLTVQELDEIRKKYFDCCGTLTEEKGKSKIKK